MRINNRFIFSQSSLQDYLSCPRRFQLRYIDHLTWPGIELEPLREIEQHIEEGRIFHNMVHQAVLGIDTERISKFIVSENLQRWWTNFNQFLMPTLLQPDENVTAVLPEFSISAPIAEFRLLAKFDLLVLRKKEIYIYDWKTNLKQPKRERTASSMQTRVYRFLSMVSDSTQSTIRYEPENVEMIYWYANFPTELIQHKYSSTLFQSDRSYLERLISEVTETDEFPLTQDDRHCKYCMFRSFCGRGVSAGNWMDIEEEINVDSATFDIDIEQIAEIEF